MFKIGMGLATVLAACSIASAHERAFTLNGCPYILDIPREFDREEKGERTGGIEIVTFRATDTTLEFEYSGDTLEDVVEYQDKIVADERFLLTYVFDRNPRLPIFMGWYEKYYGYFYSAASVGCGGNGIVEMTMTVWAPSLEREGLFKALTARLAEIAD